MSIRYTLFPIAALIAASCGAPSGIAQERTAHEQMARDIFENVVSIRSALGQEKTPEVMDYIAGELKAAGFSGEDIVITDYDARGEHVQGMMVWYRAGGEPSVKPIVLLAHVDVVDALAEDWVRDPYELTEEEGYFFGRGTADNKYGVTNLVSTFIRLKQEGFEPSRDLVMVLSGDEETDMISTRAQAKYVAENIDPAFILNSDAGGMTLGPNGEPLDYGIQGAEKTYATWEITVTNPGGHSSTPRKDNAIYELASALKAIEAYEFPVRYNALTLASLEASGRKRLDKLGLAMRAFAADPGDADAVATLRADPSLIGQTGTTCIATMLRAGHAENALPQSATATVNCRIFPGVTIEETETTLREVVANEEVRFDLISDFPDSPESGMREDVLDAVKAALAARGAGGIPVIPHMSAGGTDGMHYRNLGYDTYGISGSASKPNDTFAHGLNERVPAGSFYEGLDHWYVILKELAGE